MKEIRIKGYYEDELKNYGFEFNEENGRYEYKKDNLMLLSIKSWNKTIEFYDLPHQAVKDLVLLLDKMQNIIEIF